MPGRLLDLACGTGQIAFPLADHFREVVAVYQEEESVAYGRAKAEGARIANIRWVIASAETVALHGSPFELVAIGNAFHRRRREIVAEKVFSWLRPGGGIALLWATYLGHETPPWLVAMRALLDEWTTKLGVEDRVPADWRAAMDSFPHEQVLARAGFDYVGKYEFTAEQTWTVETLTGFVYKSPVREC